MAEIIGGIDAVHGLPVRTGGSQPPARRHRHPSCRSCCRPTRPAPTESLPWPPPPRAYLRRPRSQRGAFPGRSQRRRPPIRASVSIGGFPSRNNSFAGHRSSASDLSGAGVVVALHHGDGGVAGCSVTRSERRWAGVGWLAAHPVETVEQWTLDRTAGLPDRLDTAPFSSWDQRTKGSPRRTLLSW